MQTVAKSSVRVKLRSKVIGFNPSSQLPALDDPVKLRRIASPEMYIQIDVHQGDKRYIPNYFQNSSGACNPVIKRAQSQITQSLRACATAWL
jgi:hypothetical protein